VNNAADSDTNDDDSQGDTDCATVSVPTAAETVEHLQQALL